MLLSHLCKCQFKTFEITQCCHSVKMAIHNGARYHKLRNCVGHILLTVYLLLLPGLACADLLSTLNGFLGYLTGGVGKAVAALAIVAVGFGCFAMGKVPKAYVIAVVIGVGIIFGSSAILQALGAGQ